MQSKVSLNEISSADTLRLSYYQYFRKIEVCKSIAQINALNTTIMKMVIDGEIVKELDIDPMPFDQTQLKQLIDALCTHYKIELDKDLSKTTLYIT